MSPPPWEWSGSPLNVPSTSSLLTFFFCPPLPPPFPGLSLSSYWSNHHWFPNAETGPNTERLASSLMLDTGPRGSLQAFARLFSPLRGPFPIPTCNILPTSKDTVGGNTLLRRSLPMNEATALPEPDPAALTLSSPSLSSLSCVHAQPHTPQAPGLLRVSNPPASQCLGPAQVRTFRPGLPLQLPPVPPRRAVPLHTNSTLLRRRHGGLPPSRGSPLSPREPACPELAPGAPPISLSCLLPIGHWILRSSQAHGPFSGLYQTVSSA